MLVEWPSCSGAAQAQHHANQRIVSVSGGFSPEAAAGRSRGAHLGHHGCRVLHDDGGVGDGSAAAADRKQRGNDQQRDKRHDRMPFGGHFAFASVAVAV